MLSYLIRMVEGIGAAATWTSNLAILMARCRHNIPVLAKQFNARFPDRKATVKAWCDASFNVGLTVCLVFKIILSILKKERYFKSYF